MTTATITRRCSRCKRNKPIEEFIGKANPNTITSTCLFCREQVDGEKAQAVRLRKAMRELFQTPKPTEEQDIQ